MRHKSEKSQFGHPPRMGLQGFSLQAFVGSNPTRGFAIKKRRCDIMYEYDFGEILSAIVDHYETVKSESEEE